MALLLQTDIQKKMQERIQGSVARAGGTMNQLIDYQGCQVEDINIPDGGFGVVLGGGGSRAQFSLKALRRHVKQEFKFRVHGAKIPRDRKTIVLDMHEATRHPQLAHKYDCSISSNLLEHSPNPIFLLLNFWYITRKGGWQYHALPHYTYTYDRFRQPTPLEHMIEDFERRMGPEDTTHTEDYRQSAVVKDGWQKNFHDQYPLTYPFIHFHVFDANNTRALFEYVFQDVTNDVIRDGNFSDNLVLCRNELNPAFTARHAALLAELGLT